MVKITNKMGIDLPLAVWLLQDGYKSGAADAPPGELLSATTLMKPTRQLILQRKVDKSIEEMDISELVASRMGHGLHDSIERAWTEGNWRRAMSQLHYPDSIIKRIKINPDPATIKAGVDIPIYLEKRGFREFGGVVITGQLDFLMNQSYRDFKSTSTFAWTSGSKDQDYILQGSIYRWLFPDLITDDVMRIEFIFTDWQKFMARVNPNYPQAKVAHKDFPLMSLEDTEQWITDKLADIRKNAKLKQDQMVRCTDKELWRQKDAYKYFSDLEKAKIPGARCTKRFDNEADGLLHVKEKNKGVLITVPGEPKACNYCPAFQVCEQRKEMFSDDGEYIG